MIANVAFLNKMYGLFFLILIENVALATLVIAVVCLLATAVGIVAGLKRPRTNTNNMAVGKLYSIILCGVTMHLIHNISQREAIVI